MKITKIELKGYNQFKDVLIDLTYPMGHAKMGKPLDKVCILGQSGTGKTSLLRLIKWFVSRDRSIGKNIELPTALENSIKMYFHLFGMVICKYTDVEGDVVVGFDNVYGDKRDPAQRVKTYDDYIENKRPLMINYPAELLCKDDPTDRNQREDYPDKLEPQQIIDFAFQDVKKIWDYVLKDIKDHRAQALLFTKQIAEEASQTEPKIKDIEKKTNEYKKWLSENPNPLNALAERCLDPVLFNLGLKTKTDIDIDTIRNLGGIQLQTLAGEDVPKNFWSTGTSQLVQTMIPLYQLKPRDAIILIDEPERSLYPDIQKIIVDTYVELTPECQFFFATHSPIIASAFEPWEIVELKFDKEHKQVYRDKHYEGKNHVDNYKYYPEYLRWDSILFRVFDLPEEGGQKRLKALQELAEVNVRIKKLKAKKDLDSPEGKKLVDKYLELAGKLDWRVENHNEGK